MKLCPKAFFDLKALFIKCNLKQTLNVTAFRIVKLLLFDKLKSFLSASNVKTDGKVVWCIACDHFDELFLPSPA